MGWTPLRGEFGCWYGGGEEVVSIGEKYLLVWVFFVKLEFGDEECLVMRGCLAISRYILMTGEVWWRTFFIDEEMFGEEEGFLETKMMVFSVEEGVFMIRWVVFSDERLFRY